MKEQLVTKKTAKIAKEKGFSFSDVDLVHTDAYYTDGYLRNFYYNPEYALYLAPTQALLQKWLRDKHDIYIQMSEEFYIDGVNHLFQILIYDKNDKDCTSKRSSGQYGDNNEYKTYEDALESALQKALIRIKPKENIMKQKMSKKMDEFIDKVDSICREYGYEIYPTPAGWTGKTDKNGEYESIAIIGENEVVKLIGIDGDGRGK